jgi:hypothetical protein
MIVSTMLVVAPTVSYFNTGYFIAFYTLIYCIIYTLIYNMGIADAKAQTQAKAQKEQDASVPDPSSVSDPVLQAQENEFCLQEELDDEQTHADENNNHYTPAPYNHTLWPSPRPMNFVRAIIKTEPEFKLYGPRLTHEKAVDILAQRAYMSRREFLRTNPLSYSERYMRGMNALYLLKDSIDMLEQTLRNETYNQELRRIENGRYMYSRY